MRSQFQRVVSLALILILLLTSCANVGMPEQAGQYDVKAGSVTWDGRDYEFLWMDQSGGIHQAYGSDVQLAQSDRNYLEIADGQSVLHLREDEPVKVLARDGDGDFTSSWLPFAAGAMLGNQLGRSSSQPSYRYPPTDSFGRGETLQGSVVNSRPEAPDYTRIKPEPGAISGQAGGTGGGAAASNKQPAAVSGQTGGVGAGSAATSKSNSATSGQVGGTGSGSAASSKGSFRSGSSASSSSGSKVSPSGSKPSSGISGGKSSGGFSGGKSSGGFKGGGGGRRR